MLICRYQVDFLGKVKDVSSGVGFVFIRRTGKVKANPISAGLFLKAGPLNVWKRFALILV